MCTRCLKQEAKLHEGEIESISKYCPLDLFSGDLGRMKRALFDLYENPHNRFKIFLNGDLRYTEKVGDKNQVNEMLANFFQPQNPNEGRNILASALTGALLGHHLISPDLIQMCPSKRSLQGQCDTRSKPLNPDCILGILLRLQKIAGEVNDVTAEMLSQKLLSDVKSQDDLHNLTIWYPLLTKAAGK